MPSPPITRYRKLDTDSETSKKLNLLVSGFGLQKQVPVDDIVDEIAKLPPAHFQKLQVIKFDPNKNISFLLRHQRVGPQLGEYLTSYDSIVIYRFQDRRECFHVIFHEIGHHVYFRYLTSQMKKQWVTQIYRSEPGISPLGDKNACEDFAECYAFFITNPESLKNRPNKYRFIQSLFSN